ncbi:hypothetical protein DQ384_27550 [Sphaerisporangium album]|uniref:Condensation domain-containing protein n=1 Tax=Sphaerisporangium album TaxID=509200 RepID=A0A367FAR4_9ACTN|nr:condensation domain-containing protein [Sphaerisporangium album]RCG27029.1 hypothetical protein DQ384_27550 [Sphaerisporangium album]
MDLSTQDAADRDVLAESLAAEERARRIDLACPPLLRCALVELGSDRARLLLTFHHIVADGWSLPILHRELMAFYEPTGSGRDDYQRAESGEETGQVIDAERQASCAPRWSAAGRSRAAAHGRKRTES